MNTTPIKEAVPQKPRVTEKCVMTDEFYSVKDNLYPLFCAKCEVALEPPPLDKICQIMTNSCPQLIEQISSPPRKVPSPLRASSGKFFIVATFRRKPEAFVAYDSRYEKRTVQA